jgi:hypothetical protein
MAFAGDWHCVNSAEILIQIVGVGDFRVAEGTNRQAFARDRDCP